MEDPLLHGTQTSAHDLSEKKPLRFIRNRSWMHDQHFTARETGGEICTGTCFRPMSVPQKPVSGIISLSRESGS